MCVMARKRFSESLIYKVLNENKSGTKIPALVKQYGICQATIYNWKKKYGEISEFDRIRFSKLEKENERLKAAFIELSLENLSLKIKLEENMLVSV